MPELIRIGNLELRFLQSKEETGGSLDMFEMTLQPNARMPVPHYHESWDETVYGLAAYVQSKDLAHARRVARRLRAGQVNINYPDWDTFAPFGGYKQSGNGREYADWAIHDFLETKGIIGHGEA